MSNGRSHRRNVKAARARAALVDADRQAPTVIFGSGRGDGTNLHLVRAGAVLYGVVVPPEGASDDILNAYSVRATASVTGTCPSCAARRHLRPGDHINRAKFSHTDDCPAGDEALRTLVEQWRAS